MKKAKIFNTKKEKLYDCNTIENLINNYYSKGGKIFEIYEGCLGYGKIILYGENLKTCIVTEKYINEWTSGHTIRFYNVCPKKYQEMLENL